MRTFRGSNGYLYERTLCGPVMIAPREDMTKCAECGDLFWDEAAEEHALQLGTCNSERCVLARIKRLQTLVANYEKALSDIAGANGKVQVLSAPLAASLALNKGEDCK